MHHYEITADIRDYFVSKHRLDLSPEKFIRLCWLADRRDLFQTGFSIIEPVDDGYISEGNGLIYQNWMKQLVESEDFDCSKANDKAEYDNLSRHTEIILDEIAAQYGQFTAPELAEICSEKLSFPESDAKGGFTTHQLYKLLNLPDFKFHADQALYFVNLRTQLSGLR